MVFLAVWSHIDVLSRKFESIRFLFNVKFTFASGRILRFKIDKRNCHTEDLFNLFQFLTRKKKKELLQQVPWLELASANLDVVREVRTKPLRQRAPTSLLDKNLT